MICLAHWSTVSRGYHHSSLLKAPIHYFLSLFPLSTTSCRVLSLIQPSPTPTRTPSPGGANAQNPISVSSSSSESDSSDSGSSPDVPPVPLPSGSGPRRNPERVRRPPGEFWILPDPKSPTEAAEYAVLAETVEAAFASKTVGDGLPRSYRQAMATPNAAQWKGAAQEEMDHHKRNRSWRIVTPPPGAKIIPSMWVMTVKHNPDGSVARYKVRNVTKGFTQRPGLDYTETFAPTSRQASLRLISALAAQHDLHMHSVDITAAFTNGDLDETIYMHQPEGFHEGPPGSVCALDKAIYGLKQASRQWNLKMHAAMLSMGFTRLKSDSSIYLFVRGDVRIIMPVYVDDMTFVSKDKAAIA